MPSKDILADLTSEFRCPHCTNYMHPPIRQCINGHNYCHNCHQQMTQCQTCHHHLRNTSRAFILEKLHAKLTFKCRFASQGCPRIIPGPLIQRHEYACKFGTAACPLRMLNSCKWQGRGHQLLGHCTDRHKNNVFKTNIQKLTSPNFVRTGFAAATAYYMLFHCFQEFFKCVWEVDFDTGIMRWCVFKMITDRVSSQTVYDFVIEVADQLDAHEKLSIKGACPVMRQGDVDLVNNEQYVITHFEMVQKFCKGDELPYVVKIFPRNGS